MDALLGNFDRHGANWGFIKEDNKYTIAPIFDNGSCLFPNLVDERNYVKEVDKMKKIVTQGDICLQGDYDFVYKVAEITYTL